MQHSKKFTWQLLAGFLLCLFLGQPAWAVPGRLNFQGALTAADGSRLGDGTHSIVFSLYDAASGGTVQWSETHSTEVSNGVFSVELGSINIITASHFAGDRYLGIAVDGEAEMTPRQQILSVAFAFQAEDANTLDGLDSTSFGDITGVSAGTGLTGGAASGAVTMSVDDAYVQRRVSGGCTVGASIRIINSDGSVICETDDNSGGDITGVTAGTGLTGGGDTGAVTVAVDSAYIQRRVNNSCPTGNSIRVIEADGSIVCEADSDSGGDITGVTAGTGLTGGGTTGTVTVSAGIPFVLTSSGSGGTIQATNSRSSLLAPWGYGIYGQTTGMGGTGVYGYATASYGIGVMARSEAYTGLYATSNASGYHAGSFYTNVGSGLNGAAVYAHTDNASGAGIALWAHNDNGISTDAAVVISNDGSGALLKGFGGDGGEDEIRIENDGSLRIFDDTGATSIYLSATAGTTVTKVLQITGGSDLSEHFDIDRHLGPEPGMLVSIDPLNPGNLQVSQQAYDRKVAGIISGAGGIKTGLVMGQEHTIADGGFPVALSGRVYCLADASQGAIEPGDLLTTSNVPGHAMKVSDHSQAAGAIIGKAMTPLARDRGMVLVLVSLQ